MTTTWNPSDKSANITLSNGNLTATGSGSTNANVRAVNSIAVGQKCYFGCTYVSAGSLPDGFVLGLATSTFSLSSRFGAGTTSVGYDPDDNTGIVVYNSSAIGHAQVGAVGDFIGIAVDLVNNTLWVQINGGLWNNSGTANPSTNTGGFSISAIAKPLFPAAEVPQTGYVIIAAFATADWVHPAPAGFTEVNPAATTGASFFAMIIG